jgi:hypothetical protein
VKFEFENYSNSNSKSILILKLKSKQNIRAGPFLLPSSTQPAQPAASRGPTNLSLTLSYLSLADGWGLRVG